MIDLSQPPQITGPARAIYEIMIGASAQKVMDSWRDELLSHVMRSILMRISLEHPAIPDGGLATGGVMRGADNA